MYTYNTNPQYNEKRLNRFYTRATVRAYHVTLNYITKIVEQKCDHFYL